MGTEQPDDRAAQSVDKERAWFIARQYHCLRQTKYGDLRDYAKETHSALEGVGKLALAECVWTDDQPDLGTQSILSLVDEFQNWLRKRAKEVGSVLVK